MVLSNITGDVRNEFSIPEEIQGVIVVSVDDNSDAANKGILSGDIIMEVAQNKVLSVEEIKMILNMEKRASRNFALLLINRKGNLSFIAIKIEDK